MHGHDPLIIGWHEVDIGIKRQIFDGSDGNVQQTYQQYVSSHYGGGGGGVKKSEV